MAGVTNQTFSYSANDWLTSDGYDDNGNTTNSVKGTDTYDHENRLIRRDNGQTVVEIGYDGDGNRVRKSVITGGVTNTVWFLVDDRNLTGYAQVLEEMQLVSGQLASTRVYSYGHDLIAQEQVISNAWVVSFYGYDGHGSVRYLADATGVITDTYAYDAYGILTDQTMGSGGATPNLYLYTGEQFDLDLGLYYLRARYNNLETGRFWTFDSFEGNSSEPLSLHKYLYCSNDPANLTDPSGHDFSLGSALMGMSIANSLHSNYDNVVMGVGDALKATLFGVQAGKTGEEIFAGYIEDTVFGIATGFAITKVLQVAGKAFRGAKTTHIPEEGLYLFKIQRSTVRGNNAKGLTAAAEFAEHLRKNGVNVAGAEVYVRTPFGPRRVDIVVEIQNKFYGIEVKSGGGKLDTSQFSKDRWINKAGGAAEAYGKQAAKREIKYIESTSTIYIKD